MAGDGVTCRRPALLSFSHYFLKIFLVQTETSHLYMSNIPADLVLDVHDELAGQRGGIFAPGSQRGKVRGGDGNALENILV